MAAAPNQALESKVSDLIAAPLAEMGYELVRVAMTGKGEAATLQIMAERKDGAAMTAEDCASISHSISDALDAEPSLANRYMLEVSSPGIDRPLMKLKDYARFAGHLAQVELTENYEGRRRFKATIVKVDKTKDEIEFTAPTGEFRIPNPLIARAKLVLTDALLNASSQSQHN